MACPDCGQRQWRYDENTLTCKNGHQQRTGQGPPRRVRPWLIPTAAGATLALDLLARYLT